MSRTVLPRNACLPLFLLIAGCIEPEVSPRAPSPDPASLPYGEQPADDDLGEDPHMLALARQHPSFAGMFFEPGTDRLVVASTSTDARDAAALRQTVLTAVATELGHPQTAADGGFDLDAVHRTFEYSFLELARHRARIRPQVLGIPGVQSLSVDEQHNRIKIGLSDPSARVKVEQLATDLAIPIQMLSFAHASPAVPLVGTSRSTLSRPAMSSGPTLRGVISAPDDRLRGGYMVQAEGGPGTCTLGFTAAVKRLTPGGYPSYFVSASHCSKVRFSLDTGYWHQPDTLPRPVAEPPEDPYPPGVGQETKDPEVHFCYIRNEGLRSCRHSDASLVQTYFRYDYGDFPPPRLIALGELGRTTERSNCASCEAPITIDTASPTISIVGTRSMIVDGEELDKVGQRTGWTYGNVEETCEDKQQTGGTWILCSGQIRFAVGGGDSGSPVFQYVGSIDSTEGSANLVGILWGGEEQPNRTERLFRTGWISNWGKIKTDLGEFLLVCDYVEPCEVPM